MSDREVVLGRIRAAQRAAGRAAGDGGDADDGGDAGEGGPAGPPPADRSGAEGASADARALVDLLADRIADYGATVLRTDAAGAPVAVARALAGLGATTVAVAAALDDAWRPPAAPDGPSVVEGDALDVAALDRDVVALTTCRVAIAETGTLVLDHAEGQGPRRLTLVPDRHVCVVPAGRVVHGVDAAMARLTPARPTTFVSGGSATSDIELQRVEGVHGPRTLVVVLVG